MTEPAPPARPRAMRKALLTGHSRGLGAALALALLDRDVQVLGVSRNRVADPPDGLQEQVLDLSDSRALQAWLATQALGDYFANADEAILINNAGLLEPIGPLTAQSPADVMRAVAVNVGAPLAVSAAFGQAVPAAAGKRLLHVSSGAGRGALSGWSVYCATKAALDHHARAVMADAQAGWRVCSLAPGVIDTDMQAQIRAASVANFPDRARFEALKKDGGLATAEDCARRLVDYLLSERFGEMAVADLRELSS